MSKMKNKEPGIELRQQQQEKICVPGWTKRFMYFTLKIRSFSSLGNLS
jgi:hypothetical protein